MRRFPSLIATTLVFAVVALSAFSPLVSAQTTFASGVDCPVWQNPYRAPPNFTAGWFTNSTTSTVYPITVISDLLAGISSSNTRPIVIAIAPGIYNGSLTITKPNVAFIGCGVDRTFITYAIATNLNVGTIVNSAVNTTIEHMHVANRWNDPWQVGPNPPNPPTGTRTQAVSVVINADRMVIRNCYLYGYQDTLYSRRGLAYIYNTTILGAVDFIFGQGVMYLDRCRIEAIPGGWLTAPSTFPNMVYGIVLQSCNVTYNTSFVKSAGLKVGLGRAWDNLPMVTFIDTLFDSADMLDPLPWNHTSGHSIYVNTSTSVCMARFAEYNTRFRTGSQDWVNMHPLSCPLSKTDYPYVIPIVAQQDMTPDLVSYYSKLNVLAGWDPVDDSTPKAPVVVDSSSAEPAPSSSAPFLSSSAEPFVSSSAAAPLLSSSAAPVPPTPVVSAPRALTPRHGRTSTYDAAHVHTVSRDLLDRQLSLAPLSGAAVDDGLFSWILPFAFRVGTVTTSSVAVSTNGNLQFGGAGHTSYRFVPEPLPKGDGELLPLLSFLFTDLNVTSAAQLQVGVVGTAPERAALLRVNAVGTASNRSAASTIDVLLFEGVNRIEVRYYSVGVFTERTLIALQNVDATDFAVFWNAEALSADARSLLDGSTLVLQPRSAFVESVGGATNAARRLRRRLLFAME